MINAFQIIDENITLVRGDTLAFAVELTVANEDAPGITAPLDQDLDECTFSVSKDYFNTETAFEKSLGNGIEQADTGKYRVRIAPQDTAGLQPGNYYYDFRIGLNGDCFTLLKGAFIIAPDIDAGERT